MATIMQQHYPYDCATLTARLIAGDHDVWSAFLFDIDAAKRLCSSMQPDSARAILAAGGNWGLVGWNTTKASKRLWETSHVALVSNDGTEYRSTWLYALALAWQVEVPTEGDNGSREGGE